jgi:hypothetical protein
MRRREGGIAFCNEAIRWRARAIVHARWTILRRNETICARAEQSRRGVEPMRGRE